ncbi:PKD domain-containing protein [Candidatus Bipolaricaulota sp. J31]
MRVSRMLVVFLGVVGFAALAGPGLRETLTFASEGFASLELVLFWTGDPLSASLKGQWEGTGFSRGEVGCSLQLEPLALHTGFGMEVTGDWEASLGGELVLPPVSLLGDISFGKGGLTGWGLGALLDWEALSLTGEARWEGSLRGGIALSLYPRPLSLEAGVYFAEGEGLSEVRGGIGLSGDLGTVGLKGIYTPSTEGLLLVTEFDLRSEHLRVGFTAVWNLLRREGLRPAAAQSGEAGPRGILRYLEEVVVEASLATPPEAGAAPAEDEQAFILISSPKGSTFVVGEEISFSAKGSRSKGASLREFLWDFGDGHRAWGSEVRHRYRTPGLYRVVLTLRDADGRPLRAERLLRIVPPELVADFAWEPGEPTVLDEVCFIDLSHGEIISWQWDFGDGATSSAREPCHRYAERGDFQVTLTVTDSYGNEASVTKIVTVVNIPPHADPGGPYQGAVYTEIVFSAKGSYDLDGEIVEYRWDFGDGTTGAGETVAHAYLKPGTYEVCLTVVDDAGAEDRACTVAEVVYYPEVGGVP